jgi:hypothetical protein
MRLPSDMASGFLRASSIFPARTVMRDSPVARDTSDSPPSPATLASAPADNRIVRSSVSPLSSLNRLRISFSVAIATFDHDRTRLSIDALGSRDLSR